MKCSSRQRQDFCNTFLPSDATISNTFAIWSGSMTNLELFTKHPKTSENKSHPKTDQKATTHCWMLLCTEFAATPLRIHHLPVESFSQARDSGSLALTGFLCPRSSVPFDRARSGCALAGNRTLRTSMRGPGLSALLREEGRKTQSLARGRRGVSGHIRGGVRSVCHGREWDASG